MPISDYHNVDVLARQGQEFGVKQQQSFLVQVWSTPGAACSTFCNNIDAS